MTHKVFWQDPYLSTHSTRISTVDGAKVELEETIIYAQSGGQESDKATIAGLDVLLAEIVGTSLIYTLPSGHGLCEGDDVDIAIDWARRYALMRLHFAAELILELVYKQYPGTEKVGAHIAEDKARIDFAWQGNISEAFPGLLDEASRIVAFDQPIGSAFSDEANERRYWQIDGFARVPCGGTHLRRTGEVGNIRLKRNNIGKGKERIEIFVD